MVNFRSVLIFPWPMSNFNNQNVATGDLLMLILFTSPREAHVVLTRPEIILRVGYKI